MTEAEMLVGLGARYRCFKVDCYSVLGLRTAMVEAIIDVIILRFALFMAASLVLLVLTIRAAFLVF